MFKLFYFYSSAATQIVYSLSFFSVVVFFLLKEYDFHSLARHFYFLPTSYFSKTNYSGVGLHDPCGYFPPYGHLPPRDISWFYEYFSYFVFRKRFIQFLSIDCNWMNSFFFFSFFPLSREAGCGSTGFVLFCFLFF